MSSAIQRCNADSRAHSGSADHPGSFGLGLGLRLRFLSRTKAARCSCVAGLGYVGNVYVCMGGPGVRGGNRLIALDWIGSGYKKRDSCFDALNMCMGTGETSICVGPVASSFFFLFRLPW